MRSYVVLLVLGITSRTSLATPWPLPASGDAVVRVAVEAELSRHRLMHPVSLAPDLIVGLTNERAVAWHHSRLFDGSLGAGNGVCIVGHRETLGLTPPACASRYAGSGISFLQRLNRYTAARAGLVLVDTSPMKLAVATGVIARVASGRWWTLAAPTLVGGVVNREAGNRDRLQVPLYGGVVVGPAEFHARTGFDATLQTVADTFVIPIGAGGSVRVRSVRAGVDVTLDKALGRLNTLSWRSAVGYVEVAVGGPS
jgi:hypothetical protein